MNCVAELTGRFEDIYGSQVDEAIRGIIREAFPFECNTIRELKVLARDQRIKRYGRMTKHELYTALSWAQEIAA